MAFMRAKMKSSLVIVLALGCGILAVFWPQWRGELRAQGYYPGFGAEGKVTTAFEDLAQARAVAIQTDGKIVAAGYAVLSGNQHFALVRYNTDGTLDSSFGTGGKVTTDFFGFGRCLSRMVASSDPLPPPTSTTTRTPPQSYALVMATCSSARSSANMRLKASPSSGWERR